MSTLEEKKKAHVIFGVRGVAGTKPKIVGLCVVIIKNKKAGKFVSEGTQLMVNWVLLLPTWPDRLE